MRDHLNFGARSGATTHAVTRPGGRPAAVLERHVDDDSHDLGGGGAGS